MYPPPDWVAGGFISPGFLLVQIRLAPAPGRKQPPDNRFRTWFQRDPRPGGPKSPCTWMAFALEGGPHPRVLVRSRVFLRALQIRIWLRSFSTRLQFISECF